MRLNSQQTSHNLVNTRRPPIKPLGAAADNKADDPAGRLSGACRQFEGFMLGELLKAMQPSEGGFIPRGRAERVFMNQQCEALGEALAAREPLGLARLLRETIRPNPATTAMIGNSPDRTAEVCHED